MGEDDRQHIMDTLEKRIQEKDDQIKELENRVTVLNELVEMWKKRSKRCHSKLNHVMQLVI